MGDVRAVIRRELWGQRDEEGTYRTLTMEDTIRCNEGHTFHQGRDSPSYSRCQNPTIKSLVHWELPYFLLLLEG